MICDKVSFGITDRLLVVDDFNGVLPEVSLASVGPEF